MGTAVDYKKEIINITKKLPDDKLRELVDFAVFLRIKEKGFSYLQVKDSAEYVRNMRIIEGRKMKSGRKFINELVEWQKSNS